MLKVSQQSDSNMAEKRVAALLNLCSSCNILDKERSEISEVIADYFQNSEPSNENWSESDSDESESETFKEPESDDSTSHVGDGEEANDDLDFVEEPVVKIEGNACDSLPADFAGNIQREAAIFDIARNKSCNCKQIHFEEQDHGFDDQRRGCIRQFSPEEIVQYQLSIQDMDRAQVDMVVLGILNTGMKNGEMTHSSKRKEQKQRQKSRTTYHLLGRIVCRTTFLFLMNGMNRKRLGRLSKHYKDHGLVEPTLKSGGRKNNTRSLTLEDTQRVLRFILNFAEDYGVSLPGRVPGFMRDNIQLLPSAYPKSAVYRRYRASAIEADQHYVAASTFRRLWLQLCPYVVVARPMTDLCWRCQQNNTRIFRSANLPEEEKAEIVQQQQEHLSQVDAERQYYKNMVSESKVAMQQEGIQRLEANPPNSRQVHNHYSFDFAQQLHYPARPDQPGPIFFLTPRKCAVFGICCEGLPQQVNYLIDEAVNVSKGSNAVVSYLHHFLEHYGCGEQSMDLHCDNCSGQNKNRYLIWYLCWRVQNGLHNNITLNFMPAGHTKFAPDWCFGLFKRKFRRSEVSCLDDICTAVLDSTPESGVNIPQLVGNEAGAVFVPTYD